MHFYNHEIEAESLNTVLDADRTDMSNIMKHMCISGTLPIMQQIPRVKCKHTAVDLVSYLQARIRYLEKHTSDYRRLFEKEVFALILYSDGAEQCTFGNAKNQLLISFGIATDSLNSVFSKMCIVSLQKPQAVTGPT